MAFDDVRLPDDIEQGSKGGPRFKTTVLGLSSGHEKRNMDWARTRAAWQVGYGIMHREDFYFLTEFFYARGGRARGFRFRDWSDYTAENVAIGTGNGVLTDFQLIKKYENSGVTYTRRITRPVAETIELSADGTYPLTPVTHFTVQPLGIVRLTAAGLTYVNTQELIASFEFDIPVRFQNDELNIELVWEQAGGIPDMPIEELRE